VVAAIDLAKDIIIRDGQTYSIEGKRMK